VLIILIDDCGFWRIVCFRADRSTPYRRMVAANGLKYNRSNTPRCAHRPARRCDRRNHHLSCMGGITEMATSAPRLHFDTPNTCAPLAETLKRERLFYGTIWQVP